MNTEAFAATMNRRDQITEGELEQIRARLQKFTQLMERELIENSHKGPCTEWANMSGIELRNEILYHVAKAAFASKEGNRELLQEFLVDVANCALICLESEGLL